MMPRPKKKPNEPIDVEPVEVTEVVPLRMYEAPTRELVPSPTNPRKTFRGVEDLTESVREKGVLQPLLVRRVAGRLEVIAGERRRRAAVAAGLERVPVIERAMSDEEVLEAQVIENNQRVDVDPLEEARGFAALLEHGRDVEEIAARLGRSESYVRARLRLVHLVPRGAWALEHELVTLSGALVIATLTTPRQDEVLDELGRQCWWPEEGDDVSRARPATIGDVRAVVRRGLRALERAPWGLADAGLVPVAGACTRCPKRSGAQADLFGDHGDDRCLDGACWDLKTEATLERHRKSAGGRVIEGDEAAALLSYDRLRWNAPLVALDETIPLHDDETELDKDGDYLPTPTWREMLGDVLNASPCALVVTPEGQVIEAFDREAALAAIAERFPRTVAEEREELARDAQQQAARAGGQTSTEPGASSPEVDWKARQREADQKAKIERETRRLCIAGLVESVEGTGLGYDEAVEDLRALIAAVAKTSWSEVARTVAERRGWGDADSKSGFVEAILREAEAMEYGALAGLLVEIILVNSLAQGAELTGKGPVATMLQIHSIDPQVRRAEAKRAIEGKAKKRSR